MRFEAMQGRRMEVWFMWDGMKMRSLVWYGMRLMRFGYDGSRGK